MSSPHWFAVCLYVTVWLDAIYSTPPADLPAAAAGLAPPWTTRPLRCDVNPFDVSLACTGRQFLRRSFRQRSRFIRPTTTVISFNQPRGGNQQTGDFGARSPQGGNVQSGVPHSGSRGSDVPQGGSRQSGVPHSGSRGSDVPRSGPGVSSSRLRESTRTTLPPPVATQPPPTRKLRLPDPQPWSPPTGYTDPPSGEYLAPGVPPVRRQRRPGEQSVATTPVPRTDVDTVRDGEVEEEDLDGFVTTRPSDYPGEAIIDEFYKQKTFSLPTRGVQLIPISIQRPANGTFESAKPFPTSSQRGLPSQQKVEIQPAPPSAFKPSSATTTGSCPSRCACEQVEVFEDGCKVERQMVTPYRASNTERKLRTIVQLPNINLIQEVEIVSCGVSRECQYGGGNCVQEKCEKPLLVYDDGKIFVDYFPHRACCRCEEVDLGIFVQEKKRKKK